MTKDETFYFLNHNMLDLDERQQELYRDMLKNHGEKIDLDRIIYDEDIR